MISPTNEGLGFQELDDLRRIDIERCARGAFKEPPVHREIDERVVHASVQVPGNDRTGHDANILSAGELIQSP
jgi:hypothetical protein